MVPRPGAIIATNGNLVFSRGSTGDEVWVRVCVSGGSSPTVSTWNPKNKSYVDHFRTM